MTERIMAPQDAYALPTAKASASCLSNASSITKLKFLFISCLTELRFF